MANNSLNIVAQKIDAEGFDYCFREYASFEEVEDETFHELRDAYIKAADDLERYVEENSGDPDEDDDDVEDDDENYPEDDD